MRNFEEAPRSRRLLQQYLLCIFNLILVTSMGLKNKIRDNLPYGTTTFSLIFTKRDISMRLIRYYIILNEKVVAPYWNFSKISLFFILLQWWVNLAKSGGTLKSSAQLLITFLLAPLRDTTGRRLKSPSKLYISGSLMKEQYVSWSDDLIT